MDYAQSFPIQNQPSFPDMQNKNAVIAGKSLSAEGYHVFSERCILDIYLEFLPESTSFDPITGEDLRGNPEKSIAQRLVALAVAAIQKELGMNDDSKYGTETGAFLPQIDQSPERYYSSRFERLMALRREINCKVDRLERAGYVIPAYDSQTGYAIPRDSLKALLAVKSNVARPLQTAFPVTGNFSAGNNIFQQNETAYVPPYPTQPETQNQQTPVVQEEPVDPQVKYIAAIDQAYEKTLHLLEIEREVTGIIDQFVKKHTERLNSSKGQDPTIKAAISYGAKFDLSGHDALRIFGSADLVKKISSDHPELLKPDVEKVVLPDTVIEEIIRKKGKLSSDQEVLYQAIDETRKIFLNMGIRREEILKPYLC